VAIAAIAISQRVMSVLTMYALNVIAQTNQIYRIHLQKGTNHEY